jgi:hypothetical protein
LKARFVPIDALLSVKLISPLCSTRIATGQVSEWSTFCFDDLSITEKHVYLGSRSTFGTSYLYTESCVSALSEAVFVIAAKSPVLEIFSPELV